MMKAHGVVSASIVTHQDADVETIASAAPDESGQAIESLIGEPEVREAFVLSTCNRVEYYVVTDARTTGREQLTQRLNQVPAAVRTDLGHEAAIEHLCRVASGLESQVLGEDEILGQVRDAFHLAKEHDAIGAILEPALLKAIHIGERARSETTINEGVVSLASAAVQLLEERTHLPTAGGVVIGTGDVGRRTLQRLSEVETAQLYVANRSPEPARQLATEVDGATAISLEELPSVLQGATFCISATASDDPVLGPDSVPRGGSLLLVDLGQPPDVSPSIRHRADVAYYDLDRLRIITERTHEQRADAAEQVERLIRNEVDVLKRQFKRDQAEDVIAAMRTGAEAIKRRELRRARKRMDHGEAPPEEIVEDMADAIVNMVMAAPTEALRDAAEENDWETISTAIQIFDPDPEVDELTDETAETQRILDD